MIDEVVADRVVAVRIDGDLDLRAHPVGAGDEHRGWHIGRHAKHPAEPPKAAARPVRERRLHDRAEALLRAVRGLDVDTRRLVVDRPRHDSRSSSKDTSR